MVKRERCPKCAEVGRDTAGDNLARYANGGAWCFSCHYLEKPTSWKPRVNPDVKELPKDLTSVFHPDNLEWLKQYLNEGEIYSQFKYSPSMQRHVFQHGSYWEARSVNKQPKVISSGVKPFFVWNSTKNQLVVVEDVVSAIKVSRVAAALPLFGSHLSGDWMALIANRLPERVIIWLDHDKIIDSRRYAEKLRLLGVRTVSLTSFKDPKAYTTDEIKGYLDVQS